jgi:hypothetical protein
MTAASRAAVAALLFCTACSSDSTGPAPLVDERFSFETDLAGWTTHAADVDDGGAVAEWTIERSQLRADDGAWSVRLYQNNLTDAAKTWLARPFTVAPNTMYEVTIAFRFATPDHGAIGNFRLIAGAAPAAPVTGSDLAPFFRDETSYGDGPDQGYRWLTKSYTHTVRSGQAGTLVAVIGVWGTFEVTKTYFVDQVRVQIRPVQGAQPD